MTFFKANLATKSFADCNGMLINTWFRFQMIVGFAFHHLNRKPMNSP